MASVRKRLWTSPSGEEKTAWTVDWVDPAGGRHRRQFPRKKEADAFRIETENQLRTGTFRSEAQKMTVSDLATAFLEHCDGRRERGERMTRATFEFYRGNINNYVLAHAGMPTPPRATPFHQGIGALKLIELTTGRIGAFRDRVRAAGVSVPTTRRILATLHAMLEYARTHDWLPSNPAHRIRVFGRRDEGSKKVVPPSKELVRALIEEAVGDLRMRILFACATGVRASELHAIRWQHVDLTSGVANIKTRVDKWGNEDGQGTKTSAGIREIPIASNLVSVLRTWRLKSTFSQESDLIFPASDGCYLKHDHLIKVLLPPLLATVNEKNGLSVEGFTWHALRHFAISTWIEAGLAPKVIQTFAGHSSLAVTMDRYGHLFPSADHQVAMDRIADGLSHSDAQVS